SSPSSSRQQSIEGTTVTSQSVVPSSAVRQAGPASGGAGSSRSASIRSYAPLAPFHAYVLLFLIFPTLVVAAGAFSGPGGLTFDNFDRVLTRPDFASAFGASIQLAIETAIVGAIIGAALTWAVVRSNPDGLFRQLVVAGAGVLAQFGGV